MKKYILYATSENGDGHAQNIGTFSDLSDIKIIISMFARDVVITIEEENEE
uniref:Uncharacterized protein n=1 Tax=viral metagenome TaxID=1070528 RepID=A0A6M3XSW1_9ZZZZ